jgi:hypothetical protein
MRSIVFGAILLLASTAVVHAVQAEKPDYAQAYVSHRQSITTSREQRIGVDQPHPRGDALTRRIERDNIRLDQLMDICPSC